MEIGKIITINDISIEIILSNTDIKIGDILEVNNNDDSSMINSNYLIKIKNILKKNYQKLKLK